MSKLEENEETYLRSLTIGFDSNEMADMYKDMHKITFTELLVRALRIKEAKDRNKDIEPDAGGSNGGGDQSSSQLVQPVATDATRPASEEEQRPKPHVIDLSADSDVDQEEQLPYQPPQTYKAAQQLASHERLVRLKTWLDDYPWTAKTTRCEILDAFMVLDKARTIDNTSFPSRDALRSFCTSRALILSEHSVNFAMQFMGDRSGPCAPYSNKGSARTTRQDKGNSNSNSNQEPELEFAAEDSDLSEPSSDSDFEDTEPSNRFTPARKRKRVYTAQEAQDFTKCHQTVNEIFEARVKRMVEYANTYKGYQSGVKVDFRRWVVVQDREALKLGIITYREAFKTIDAVQGFLNNPGGILTFAQSPQLRALFAIDQAKN